MSGGASAPAKPAGQGALSSRLLGMAFMRRGGKGGEAAQPPPQPAPPAEEKQPPPGPSTSAPTAAGPFRLIVESDPLPRAGGTRLRFGRAADQGAQDAAAAAAPDGDDEEAAELTAMAAALGVKAGGVKKERKRGGPRGGSGGGPGKPAKTQKSKRRAGGAGEGPAPAPPDAPPPPVTVELRIKELQRLVAPSGAVTVQVHCAGADHTTTPTPVLNGYSTVEAWTRLALPRPDEGLELNVWLTRAGWAAALWPTPWEVFLGRAVLPDVGVPAGPPGTRGPWEVARLELRRSDGTDFFTSRGGGGGGGGPAVEWAGRPRAAAGAPADGGPPAPPPRTGARVITAIGARSAARRAERRVAAAERCPSAAAARAAARAGEAAAARAAARAAGGLATTSFDEEDEDGTDSASDASSSSSFPTRPPSTSSAGGDGRAASPEPRAADAAASSPPPHPSPLRGLSADGGGGGSVGLQTDWRGRAASPPAAAGRAPPGRSPSPSPPPPPHHHQHRASTARMATPPPRPRARSEDVYALPDRYGTPPGVGFVRASSPGGGSASEVDGRGGSPPAEGWPPPPPPPPPPPATKTSTTTHPETEPEDNDATDVRLPELDRVLHGARGWIVVEWRVTVAGDGGGHGDQGGPGDGAAPAPASRARLARTTAAEVPIARLPRSLHSYAHGGFMGLAASMMADPAWRAALEAEDAAAAGRAAGLWTAGGGDPTSGPALRLPIVLENSPVLCAYGFWRLGCTAPVGASAANGHGGGAAGAASESEAGAGSAKDAPAAGPPPQPTVGWASPVARPAAAASEGEGGAATDTAPPPAASPFAAAASPPRAPLPQLPPRPPPPLPPSSSGRWASRPAKHGGGGSGSDAPARRPVWPPSAGPARAASVGAHLSGYGRSGAHTRHLSSAATSGDESGAGGRGRGLLDHPALARLLAGRGRDWRDSVADLAALVGTGGAGGGMLTPLGGGGGDGAGSPGSSSSSSTSSSPDGSSDDGQPRPPASADRTPPASADGSPTRSSTTAPREDDDDDEAWPDSAAAPTAARLGGPQEASGLARLYAAAASRAAAPPSASAGPPVPSLVPQACLACGSGPATNRYGYAPPCGLEWDVWIDPGTPADLARATVDHGTPGALLAQAATSGLPGLRALARAAGAARILREGVAPAAWLTAFGRALNRAVAGDPGTPLPLAGPPGFSYRLHVRVDAGRGGLFGSRPLRARGASRVYVRASVRGSTPLPRARGPPGEPPPPAPAPAGGAGGGEAPPPTAAATGAPPPAVIWSGPDAAFQFWPVAAPLTGAVLHLEVRATGVIAGRLRHRRLGSADVPLTSAAVARAGGPPPPPAWVDVEPFVPHRLRRRRARAGAASTAAVGAALGRSSGGGLSDAGGDDGGRGGGGRPDPDGPRPPRPARPPPPSLTPSGSEADVSASEGGRPLGARTGSLRVLRGAWASAAALGSLGGGGQLRGAGGDSGGGGGVGPSSSEVDLLSLGRRAPPGAAPPAAPSTGGGLRRRRSRGGAVPPTALGAGGGGGGGGGPPTAPPPSSTPAAGQLRLWLRLEEVCHLAAAEAAGVDRAAAQTALALLSAPGGLVLDVKSGYSTAADVQLFAGALTGLGVHVSAVASFARRQLAPRPAAASRRAPGVRLFHGLNTLELAVDRGTVSPGEAVLFNGASLVLPHTAGRRAAAAAADPATRPASAGGALPSGGGLLDPVALRRCVALIERARCAAGVYLQEADAGAAAVDALTRAVAAHAPLFPLGFAYGGAPGLAIAALAQAGRGFAAQQVVEELAARRSLARRAAARVAAGEHAAGSLTAAIADAHRLLRGAGPSPLSLRHQALLLRLLWDLWPPPHLSAAVAALGGPAALVSRFWAHYEATSPLTLLEAGANWNLTKPLLRLLRDRGVLADLAWPDKAALADWLSSPALYGTGLTYVLMARGVRAGLHKHAKEGLCCLLESCTAAEAAGVVALLGGRRALMRRLRGNVPWASGWAYARRVADVEAVHAVDPGALAVDCGPGGGEGEAWEEEEEGEEGGGRPPPPHHPALPVVPYGALPHRRRAAAPPPWVLAARIAAAGDAGAAGVGWTPAALVARFLASRRRAAAAWRYGPCHSRDKTGWRYAGRVVRKTLIAALTVLREVALAAVTGGVWPLLVTFPRLVAPFLSGAVGTSAAVAALALSIISLIALVVHVLGGRGGGSGAGTVPAPSRAGLLLRPTPPLPLSADALRWERFRVQERTRRVRAEAAAGGGGRFALAAR